MCKLYFECYVKGMIWAMLDINKWWLVLQIIVQTITVVPIGTSYWIILGSKKKCKKCKSFSYHSYEINTHIPVDIAQTCVVDDEMIAVGLWWFWENHNKITNLYLISISFLLHIELLMHIPITIYLCCVLGAHK